MRGVTNVKRSGQASPRSHCQTTLSNCSQLTERSFWCMWTGYLGSHLLPSGTTDSKQVAAVMRTYKYNLRRVPGGNPAVEKHTQSRRNVPESGGIWKATEVKSPSPRLRGRSRPNMTSQATTSSPSRSVTKSEYKTTSQRGGAMTT